MGTLQLAYSGTRLVTTKREIKVKLSVATVVLIVSTCPAVTFKDHFKGS